MNTIAPTGVQQFLKAKNWTSYGTSTPQKGSCHRHTSWDTTQQVTEHYWRKHGTGEFMTWEQAIAVELVSTLGYE